MASASRSRANTEKHLWTSDQLFAGAATDKTHNTNTRLTSIPPAGFEHEISAGEWPRTYILDRAAIGTGLSYFDPFLFIHINL